MKRSVLWLLGLCCVLVWPASAQQMPAEWTKYTNRVLYFHDVRTDRNSKRISESLFCENLRQSAIVGLARSIEVQVAGSATTDKTSFDGTTHTAYHSTSTLSTNVDLQLVQTDVHYNRTTGEGVAIAWIDKQAARTHYLNELRQAFGKVEGSLKMAEEHSATGYDKRATAELKSGQEALANAEGSLSRLSLFGLDGSVAGQLSERHSALRLAIEQALKKSAHGQTLHIACSADLFGVPFATLGSQLKGALSAEGCNFVATDEGADWRVVVRALAREYAERNVGGTTMYTSYVDATLSITNCHTGQVVCVDEISVKGTHTVSHSQAARTAFGDVQKKLVKTIKLYIN